jgi:ABC-type Co2+ transport system permease subunit
MIRRLLEIILMCLFLAVILVWCIITLPIVAYSVWRHRNEANPRVIPDSPHRL